MRKRFVLFSLLALLTFASFAGERMQSAIDAFMASPGVCKDGTAVAIVDLANGRIVASAGEKTPLIPASIMKSVTTASLCEVLTPDWTFKTSVFTDGPVRKGILKGNLIVVGSGDPSLNASCEPLSEDITVEIVNALKQKGVSEITGRLIVDQSIFPGPSTPPSWQPGDLPHSYGTGVHGLNFENNSTGKSSVSNPAAIFDRRLSARLREAGIEMKSEQVAQGERKKLLTHVSPPIGDIMCSCMMRSDNMFAESLLRTYAIRRGESGETPTGANLEMEYWKSKGMPMQGVNIVDGSGLSRDNRLTADFLAQILAYMADNVEYASYFPLAGQEGTLKKFLADTPLATYIALKTGSMNGIQCYAGYKIDDDFAPTHAVVIIGNRMPHSRNDFRQAVEKMLLDIFTNDVTP